MVSKERIEDYLAKTKKAMEKVEISAPEHSHLHPIARDFLQMVVSYYDDAVHFYKKGDIDNAFACVNYAHGWLDAGARFGLFDTGGDHELFTLAR